MLLVLTALLLAVLLAIATREWLVLRARQRQRDIFRPWPIRKVPVERIDAR